MKVPSLKFGVCHVPLGISFDDFSVTLKSLVCFGNHTLSYQRMPQLLHIHSYTVRKRKKKHGEIAPSIPYPATLKPPSTPTFILPPHLRHILIIIFISVQTPTSFLHELPIDPPKLIPFVASWRGCERGNHWCDVDGRNSGAGCPGVGRVGVKDLVDCGVVGGVQTTRALREKASGTLRDVSGGASDSLEAIRCHFCCY